MGERFEPGQRIRIVGEYGPLKPVQATVINATERELRLRLEGQEPHPAGNSSPSDEGGEGARTPAPLAQAQHRSVDRRAQRHYPVWWPCVITSSLPVASHPAVVIDVSTGGVAIETAATVTSERLLLTLESGGATCELHCAVVASEESWRGAVLHVAFEDLGEQQEAFIARLVDRWRNVFDEAQSYLVRSTRSRQRPRWIDDPTLED